MEEITIRRKEINKMIINYEILSFMIVLELETQALWCARQIFEIIKTLKYDVRIERNKKLLKTHSGKNI